MFESVIYIFLQHDAPRVGVASYMGRPHYFECDFDDAADEYGNRYSLTPLVGELHTQVVTYGEQCIRWARNVAAAPYASVLPSAPSSPGLESELKTALRGPEALRATAEFRRRDAVHAGSDYEARWSVRWIDVMQARS